MLEVLAGSSEENNPEGDLYGRIRGSLSLAAECLMAALEGHKVRKSHYADEIPDVCAYAWVGVRVTPGFRVDVLV